MLLYHASDREISAPDVLHSRRNVDFGRGFYTTPIREQADKWGERFLRRGKGAVISRYAYDEAAASALRVLTFPSYSDEWLDFIRTCRRELDETDYDIVVGGVANDRVFNTVELYNDGLIPREEAIRRLRYEKPNLQICFRTQRAIDACLRFEGSEER